MRDSGGFLFLRLCCRAGKKKNAMKNPSSSYSLSLQKFKPAKYAPGKDAHVVYYVFDPTSKALKRMRVRVNHIAEGQRRKYANKLVKEINDKLFQGWNPLLENSAPAGFTPVVKALDEWLSIQQKQAKHENIRKDTLRSYKSQVNLFLEYMKHRKAQDMLCINLSTEFIQAYLNYKMFDRGNSPKTVNNTMNYLNIICRWMLQKRFMNVNPMTAITAFTIKEKMRKPITPAMRKMIREHLDANNPHYLRVCLLAYHCLIRRTEITKIKISHLNLYRQYIYMPQDITKNTTARTATIPDAFMPYLLTLNLDRYQPDDYLVSTDFLPGPKPIKPQKITDTWKAMREALGLPVSIQFYSLRDTGITQMIRDTGDPVAVRDHADHHSLEITNMYVGQDMHTANEAIKRKSTRF